ncbi:single-pass membrane and coiled-coil domain-containing protein 4 homolog [Babylonia areolata]|uniref:single-pass membrane and coiled-coil domain-containing protein 4 homolog n=1 Tax=Babylonia areolata TaxID=304850 RepID=UPI003FD14988
MRQLKGKVKESRKERRDRKQENMANKQNILKVVLPVLGVIVSLIVGFIYLNSRPKAVQ